MGNEDRYVRLLRRIWTDDDYRALDHTAQWLYMAFISQPDMTSAGVLNIIERRWAGFAIDLNVATVSDALDRLSAAGFVVIDNDTAEVWVRSYIRHDRLVASPNGRKAVDNSIDRVLSPIIAQLARDAARDAINPQVTAPDEGATEGATEGAKGGDTPPQQPAASSHKPTTINQQPAAGAVREPPDQPPTPNPTPSTAAAKKHQQIIDTMVGIRIKEERGIRSPTQYAKSLREKLPLEHGDTIERYATQWPDAPISLIAAAVLTGDTHHLGGYQKAAQ